MSKQDTYLIQCVNKLHDVFTDLGVNAQFDLPQIAVVGSQSAGKSSVLENFVGWDFLPRGKGIVTRCPLILQMLIGPEKYGQFSHSDKKYTDFVEIRKEIERRTDEVSGDNKGISKDPINLKIYSPEFLNLTLVDLPGLTRNPTGSQPANIEQQLEEMIIEYIQKDTCLILAVSPANTDLANSDALKLARRVDPDGKRTTGVLTKLDIMDGGTNARDVFLGKTFALPRGYFGVVSRSQSDIDAEIPMHEARQKEKEFFKTHKAYQDLPHRLGTTVLLRTLNRDLAKHIREKLPEFREKILEKMREAEETLKGCQKIDLSNGGVNVLHKIVNELSDKMTKCIRGTAEVMPEEQQIGTKIHYLFHEKLQEDYWAKEVDEQQINNDIAKGIRNIRGIQTNLYAPDGVLKQVVKAYILGKRDAMEKCLKGVKQELRQLFGELIDENVARCFRQLAVKVEEAVYGQLSRCFENCSNHLQEILEEESGYLNPKQADFVISDQIPNREIIHTGNVLYDNKKFWCVLSANNLTMNTVPVDEKNAPIRHINCKITIPYEDRYWFIMESKADSTDKRGSLQVQNKSEFNAWKDAFTTTGFLETNFGLNSAEDFQLESQINLIRKHLAVHMRLFTKKYLDTVPKKIAHHMVEGMIGYVNEQLFGVLVSSNDLVSLFDENPEHKEIRERATAELDACKQALEIIDEQSARLLFE